MWEITLSRRHALVAAVLLLAVLALAGTRLVRAGAAEQHRQAAAPLEPVRASSRPRLVVHVVGAVRRPGLYRLPEGARIADAVARAGGPTRRAALALVNLAAPLADGAQVLVPVRPPPGARASAVPGEIPSGPVSLSAATLEQLDELPGIGPVTAQKILDWRETHGLFRSVDDLDQVPGIGPTRVEQLRDLVTP